MSSQYSYSSASSSSSSSSSPGPDSPFHHTPPPSSSSPVRDPSPPPTPQSSIMTSPPLASHPFTPHPLGIRIYSPQPIFGPMSSSISRASFSPRQVRTSPVEQRSSPLGSPTPRRSTSPLDSHAPCVSASSEDPLPALPLSPSSSSSATGLRISIPPPNPNSSTSTPSPPLLVPFPRESSPNALPPAFDITIPGSDPAPSGDVPLPSGELNIDFTEFDADGLSALEKIYLFSRSRAGFHRVFIAHALPRYLLGSDAGPSNAEIEQISPGEAVEYVLPLLNGLAMDEDERVKEALAAELVPIIWWFITHCRLVDDELMQAASHPLPQTDAERTEASFAANNIDPSWSGSSTSTSSQDVTTFISVQAFTPILGTLLLSSNGLVGGSARYAVVELLRRLRRANDREDSSAQMSPQMPSTPHQNRATHWHGDEEADQEESTYVGLFGRGERRLFEHELVFQVVIGMGRLDMDEGQREAEQLARNAFGSPGAQTVMLTPQTAHANGNGEEYFSLSFPDVPAPPPHVPHALAPLPEFGPSPAGASLATVATSLVISPSPSFASSVGDSISGSPSPSSSTPSLVFSSSTSSFDFSTQPVLDAKMEDGWVPPSPRPTHAALPPRSPPPSEEEVHEMPSMRIQAPSSSPVFDSPPGNAPGWLSPASGDIEMMDGEEADFSEEAAVGRLSSMSLMAAVTASGSIDEETKTLFVREVERVGRDPVYWVRREASFAVGALAKVVPVEIVGYHLLPLFETLCKDTTWHVRHSVLFALPAILSRLGAQQRRQLALEVVLPLARDEEQTVRSAVLEALGEVMHTFADDEGGPPHELLNLFLGIRETEDAGGGIDSGGGIGEYDDMSPQLGSAPPSPPVNGIKIKGITGTGMRARSVSPPSQMSRSWSNSSAATAGVGPDIFDDPQRPLVCAFNYPAVALTLGRARWPELRTLYLSLAQNASLQVRRTLAASLGELAKIVGEEYARRDLMGVWWASVRAVEGEVRLKVIECLEVFVRAVAEPERAEVVRGLHDEFAAGRLCGWREREEAVKVLAALVEIGGIETEVLRLLVAGALDDRVAAVREAAVAVIPVFVRTWRWNPWLVDELRRDVRVFGKSESFRKRTTFVMCEQELLSSEQGDVVLLDNDFWTILSALAQDTIVDVRIRVARLLAILSDRHGRINEATLSQTVELARSLAQDTSHEVQAFVRTALSDGARPIGVPSRTIKSAATFSRPPPPPLPSPG